MKQLKITTLIALFLCSCQIFTQEKEITETIEKNFKMPHAKVLVVNNINGKIEVIATDSDKLQMLAKKIVRHQDENIAKQTIPNIQIQSSYENGQLKITTEYLFKIDAHAQVDYLFKVPAGFLTANLNLINGFIHINQTIQSIDINANNSSVKLLKTSDNVIVKTNNGHMEVIGNKSTKQKLELRTQNGKIKAQGILGTAIIETKNGNIDVSLVETISANVNAEVSVGTIKSDFPLVGNKRIVGEKKTGNINGGKNTLVFKSNNGKIRITKESQK